MSREAFVPLRSPWAWGVPLLCLLFILWLGLADANQSLFLAFNRLSSYTGEALWANVTAFGDALVVFSLALLWAGRRPRLLWALLLAALFGTLYVHGLKQALELARPAEQLAGLPELIVIGPRLHWFSFPSGHSAAIFALAGLLCQPRRVPLPWKWLAVAVAATVAVSRMVVGAHWPLDVLAGAGGGWVSAVAAAAVAERVDWGVRLGVQRVLAALLAAGTVFLIFFHDSGYPQARVMEIAVGIAVLVGAMPGLWRLFAKAQVGEAPS